MWNHIKIFLSRYFDHTNTNFLVYIKLNPHEKSQRNIFLWWEGFSIDFLFVLITVQNALVLTWFLCRFNIFLNIIFLMFLLILTKIFFCESYLFKVKDSMFSPFASRHHCKKKKIVRYIIMAGYFCDNLIFAFSPLFFISHVKQYVYVQII